MYGRKKIEEVWDIVRNGTTEKYIGYIRNIKRGNDFEKYGYRSFSKYIKINCGTMWII